MTEPEANGADWIRTWIAQQREQLQRMRSFEAGADPGPGQLQDLAARWLDIGQSYLQGLAQFAQSAGPDGQAASAISSRFNEEMLGAWQGWTGVHSEGREANQRFSDLLGRLPPLGLAREHTEAWRELAAAQRECQELGEALRMELVRVQNDALSLLEQRIRERELAKQPVGAWRDVYGLWVECGERAFAQVAHSEAYGRLQAEFGNAAVRLRARQQTILEHALRQFDLPTRSELNTVHRQVRELRERIATLEAQLVKPRGSGS